MISILPRLLVSCIFSILTLYSKQVWAANLSLHLFQYDATDSWLITMRLRTCDVRIRKKKKKKKKKKKEICMDGAEVE